MGAEDAAPDVFVYRDAGIVPTQGKKQGISENKENDEYFASTSGI